MIDFRELYEREGEEGARYVMEDALISLASKILLMQNPYKYDVSDEEIVEFLRGEGISVDFYE